MRNEFEIIQDSQIKYLNIFLVNINYRNSHMHREFEIILVLDGEIMITSKHESNNFSSGSVVIFNPNQPHEIKSCQTGALILCLQVSSKFCSNYFSNLSNLVFDSFNINEHLSEYNYQYIQSLTLNLAFKYYEKKNAYEFSCMSILNELFSILLNNLPYHIVSNEEKIASLQKLERLNRILNFIDENYMYKLSLNDISNRENLSISYLSHFIKDNLNQSFQEYINNHRFNHSKKLLLTTNMKLIDICFECGFSDYRYLYKAYRENYNCTPNEYRKSYKQVTVDKNQTLPYENFYTDEDSLDILRKLLNTNI